MVGPIPEEEKRRSYRQLSVVFVGFVAASTGMTALYAGASPGEIGLVLIAGAVAGVALLVALGVWP